MRGRTQYRAMLLLDAGILVFLLVYRAKWNVLRLPYPHLLVDYDLGFIRRGLLGEVVSLFLPIVPAAAAALLGALSIALALGLYIALFRRDFGFSAGTLPLCALVFGSPCFFKNFAFNLGYLDVFGCIAATAALLLPVTRVYPALLAGASALLVLLHPLLFALYVPTIALIGAMRFGPGHEHREPGSVLYVGALLAIVTAVFAGTLAFGGPSVPKSVFLEHMRERAADGFDAHFVSLWYSTASENVQMTAQHLRSNLLESPVYIGIFLLHLPLVTFFLASLRSVADAQHRRAVCAGLLAVSAADVAVCFLAFDYSRWFSAWAVCMILALHAIRGLPSKAPGAEAIDPGSRRTLVCCWLVTLVPKVGTVGPF